MESKHQFLILISLLSPLGSFVTVWLLPSKRHTLIGSMASIFLLLAFVTAAFLLNSIAHEPLSVGYEWFSNGSHAFTIDFLVTRRSSLMLAVVAFISLLVHIYSMAYMEKDPHYRRYFAMLGFFTFAMQGIVLSNNLLLLFMFWELVGFASYMLIGHWTEKPAAGGAASKAFILNRIGDAGFMIGLMIVWSAYGTFALPEILAAPASPSLTAAALCLFCGVIGKSAQFPLFTWLPDAMVGPTPVSALIHAATMVAAGVYLLVTLFGLFTEQALMVVAIAGMITAIAGALAALSQFDLKKILAYSTMSQLGLMVLAIGMGAVDAAFLHLVTHAFFKGCLFLSAGIIIHTLQRALPPHLYFDVQDIRHLGGLKKAMPFTFAFFLVSGASLAGVPFFSGFLSKEAILTALVTHTNLFSWLMLVVIVAVSFLTVLYTFRMVWFIFLGEARTVNAVYAREHGKPLLITAGLLAFCSLWFIVSWNPFNFKGWMHPAPEPSTYGLRVTIFSVLWVMAALLLSWRIFRRGSFRTHPVLKNGFYIDRLYGKLSREFIDTSGRAVSWFERIAIDRTLHGFAYGQVIIAHVAGWIDRVFVDGTVNGAARVAGWGGKFTRSFHGGNIQLYIFWAVFAIIIFIIWALK